MQEKKRQTEKKDEEKRKMMKGKVINYFALNLSRKVNFSIPILQRQQTNIMSLSGDKRKVDRN